jgi:hypothetical protein
LYHPGALIVEGLREEGKGVGSFDGIGRREPAFLLASEAEARFV